MSEDGCPVCGKPPVKAYQPFCSRRCADVDLSRWLKGGYAIPGRTSDDGEEELPKNPPESGE